MAESSLELFLIEERTSKLAKKKLTSSSDLSWQN